MTDFCRDCGYPNTYSLNKPNFCNKCGKSLAGKVVAKKTPVPHINIVDEIEEEAIFDFANSNKNIFSQDEFKAEIVEPVRGLDGLLAGGNPGNDTFARDIKPIKSKKDIKAKQEQLKTWARQRTSAEDKE